MKAKVYTVTTAKGGTGKSTLLIHLAEVLTNQPRNRYNDGLNKTVLIIDTDAQANTSHYFEKSKGTIYKSMLEKSSLVIEKTVNPRIDIVVAGMELAKADYTITTPFGRERILADLIEPVRDKYDVILIDTAPSLGVVTMNAMYCADHIIIPTVAEPFAIEGLQLTLTTLNDVQTARREEIPYTIVITRRKRSSIQDSLEESIREAYGDVVCSQVMHEKIVYAEKTCGVSHSKLLNSEIRYMPWSLGMIGEENETEGEQ